MFVWIRSAMQVSGLSWSVQCARYWECNTQWNWKRYLWHEWNPRVSTLQWSRLETNVSTKTTCRLTLRSLLRGSVVPSQVSSGLLLNTLLAEPEFNVLVVVWSGERNTRGTTRITGCDTAQIERILDKTLWSQHAFGYPSVSSQWEWKQHSAPIQWIDSVPSCVLLSTSCQMSSLLCYWAHTSSMVAEQRLPHNDLQQCALIHHDASRCAIYIVKRNRPEGWESVGQAVEGGAATFMAHLLHKRDCASAWRGVSPIHEPWNSNRP